MTAFNNGNQHALFVFCILHPEELASIMHEIQANITELEQNGQRDPFRYKSKETANEKI